jgi:hypothetical protein
MATGALYKIARSSLTHARYFEWQSWYYTFSRDLAGAPLRYTDVTEKPEVTE